MSQLHISQSEQSFIERFMNKLVGPFVTIFTLHRSAPASGAYSGIDESMLEQCLKYASEKGYHFVSIDQLVQDALEGKSYKQPSICFTLDDGYTDQTTRLLPLLLNYKTSPTLFVITDFLDQQMWPWDAKIAYLIWNTPLQAISLALGPQKLSLDLSSEQKRIFARRQIIQAVKTLNISTQSEILQNISDACLISIPTHAPADFSPATWDKLRELETQGLTVGSHTKSHLVFNSALNPLISFELEHSKRRLKEELKNPSSVFCYPLGTKTDFSPDHIHLVRDAGYIAAISTISNVTDLDLIRKQPYQIQRIGFPTTFEKFVRYISWKEAMRSKLPF